MWRSYVEYAFSLGSQSPERCHAARMCAVFVLSKLVYAYLIIFFLQSLCADVKGVQDFDKTAFEAATKTEPAF